MVVCRICGTERAEQLGRADNRMIFYFACPVCGRYGASDLMLRHGLGELDEDDRFKLSGVTRAAWERGDVVTMTTENIEDLVASGRLARDPLEAMDRILMMVYEGTSSHRGYVPISMDDYPLVFARGRPDFEFYLGKLVNLGLLEPEGDGVGSYRLTLDGWQHVAELRKQGQDSNLAFVAMWFNEETAEAWSEGFEPALRATGYEPVRIDLVEHNDKIDDRILADIKRSGLLVADFTGQRGGVYFETGFALGLGIPVIWCCRADQVGDLHFDTRQYNHIPWENPAELRERLTARIEATLGVRTGDRTT